MSLCPRRRDRSEREKFDNKIDVGVLGATGIVGQQLVVLLDRHPWFQLTWLGTSERSKGRRYGDLPWRLPGKVPDSAVGLRAESLRPVRAPRLVFSVLDAAVAGEVERDFAIAGHYVVSNARNFRMDPLVPLLVPVVNAHHLDLVATQQRKKGWSGAIVTNPRCRALFLAVVLEALRDFDVQRVIVTPLEASSDTVYPDVPSLDVISNVIPWMEREGDEIAAETQKALGRLAGDAIEADPMRISVERMHLPVFDNQMEMVSVELRERVSTQRVGEAFREFSGARQAFPLPSAPAKPIVVRGERDRPQPPLDTERARGTVVHVGSLGKCSVLNHKFVIFRHNTIRGAAGAALLNAELIVARSFSVRQTKP
jgi:aspartate-semialdehyde dehydrogenase